MPESIAYNFKKILLTTIGIGLFVVIGIYTVMKMKDVIWGVQVTVRGVIDGETVTEPKITLEGNARNIEVLTINDRVVGVSEDGEFRDSLILSPGYNIVSIKGDDKFGKHISQQYRVVYKKDPSTALSIPETSTRSLITN
ncbi:MAG: hypothetical protein KBC42_02000 [Candidatus Pacebacteria bacterium]|jgi:hypothetical protein|nr:hypothetical protein [Candidatus Paceibacterota bacterium]MBP9780675.1 hypothetical protein [Candidatus Paceibacterota bacterium]